jgi:hypothetical protein
MTTVIGTAGAALLRMKGLATAAATLGVVVAEV